MGATLLCELGLFLLCTLLCTGHVQDAVLTIEPSSSSFFIGEFVTFKCDMNEGEDTDWYYEIRKDGREFVPYNTDKYFRLEIISTRDSGEYQCSGSLVSSRHIKNSNTVSITVLADKPRATLTAATTIIPVGGSVTLTCSVQSSDGWKYEWFRRTQTTSEGKIRDQQNRDIRVSEGGIYSCRGTRGNPDYYTDISDVVTIEITSQSRTEMFPTLLIAGLLCGILLILLLLLCYIKLLKDKSFIRTQSTNQSSAMKHRINQGEAQNSQNTSLQGDACIYESIGDYDDREKAECRDFTYSLIELKNFTKKDDSLLYADATYSKAECNSDKRESATEAADEGVYSEIKPQETQGAFML
uniref:Ig-like domain-containing protein n=1 Tax=Astatotilapia calliptera TaxID=8154 RepID=A0AAX7W279_ASTCA